MAPSPSLFSGVSPSPSLFPGDGVTIAITFFWGRCHHHHHFFHARPKPRGAFFMGVAFPCSRVRDFWCFLGVAASRPRAPVKRTIAITSPRALFLHPSPSLWSRTGSHRHHFDVHHQLGGGVTHAAGMWAVALRPLLSAQDVQARDTAQSGLRRSRSELRRTKRKIRHQW